MSLMLKIREIINNLDVLGPYLSEILYRWLSRMFSLMLKLKTLMNLYSG